MAIQQVQNLPQQYVTDHGADYGKQLAGLTSIPLDTAKLAPQVAAQDPLQTQAYNLAGSGVGAYQPYLTQQAAYSGPTGYQSFMSPYQTDVIDATLSEFDRQQTMGGLGLRDQAIQAGAYGGGREGVQRAEYMNQGAMNRANLQAQLLNQGFTQANQLAQQDMMTRQGLGTYMDQMGQAQQAYDQATKDASTMAAREAEFEPYTRLGLIGQQLAQIQPGAFPTTTVGYQQSAAPASPMASFLGGAAGAGGILGKLGIFGS